MVLCNIKLKKNSTKPFRLLVYFVSTCFGRLAEKMTMTQTTTICYVFVIAKRDEKCFQR